MLERWEYVGEPEHETIRAWLHLDKEFIATVRPGKCYTVAQGGGSEDVVHIGQGKFLVSRSLDLATAGEIALLDVNDGPSMVTANLTNVPQTVNDFLALPHGMSTWKDPSSEKLYLYVITHPKKEDRIEVFEVQSPYQLRYIKTIMDPAFIFMNDLVVVDKDKFYITRYAVHRNIPLLFLEHYSHLKLGSIFYFDGRKAREVTPKYFLPNGINASPDKRMIYLAEWGGQSVRAFRRQRSNDLVEVWEKHLDSGGDNIDVDENGDLWIGANPITWRAIDFWNIFGTNPPSQVIRVKIRDQAVSEIEEIYADDGSECSGSSVGVYADGKLVIGTVSKQTIVCDVNYLSR